MAADFIESQDGNLYLRLTGNTTQIYFNATSESANTYTMTFAGLQVNNTGSMIHYFNNSDDIITYEGVQIAPFTNYRLDGTGASFVEINPGLFIIPPAGRSGTFDANGRHYIVTWNTPFQNANYTPIIEVLQNGLSAAVQNQDSVDASHWATTDITTTGFKVQFKNNTLNDDNGNFIGAYGFVRSFSASATAPFSISKNGGVNDPSYVGANQGQVITAGGSGTRYYLVTGVNQNGTQYTTTNQDHFLCLGNTVLQFQNNTIAHPGIPKDKNLFVKSSGNWKPSRNIFVKHQNSWRQCEKVWVKSGGVWKESYVRNSSDYVNMLELYDDELDFAVQVVAQN